MTLSDTHKVHSDLPVRWAPFMFWKTPVSLHDHAPVRTYGSWYSWLVSDLLDHHAGALNMPFVRVAAGGGVPRLIRTFH